MACSVCSYPLEELLITIDDGVKRYTLCPNCITGLAIGMTKEEEIPYQKSEFNTDESCLICKDKKVYFKDADGVYDICKNHAFKLVKLHLNPKEFKILSNKYGVERYFLHDDFYIDGRSIQGKQ